MTLTCLGKITQPTPGTPIRLATDTTIKCSRILVSGVVQFTTGRVYFGNSALNTGTLAGVVKIFPANTTVSTVPDSLLIATADGADELYPADYYIDTQAAGDGVLVSYWQT